MDGKRNRGQFYTSNSHYILEGLSIPKAHIIEPFAGKGDLVDWAQQFSPLSIEMYDIDPKRDDIVQRDTLLHPPQYTDKWVITNPPYLARNKCIQKNVFEMYTTNDLYKCFMKSIQGCSGGILIIPAGFFLSPRDIDVRGRHEFLSRYRLIRVNYFEETVFPDTTTTVVALSFVQSDVILSEQHVEWVSFPTKDRHIFTMSQRNDWIIGGDIYKLPVSKSIHIHRYVEGRTLKQGAQVTSLTLSALDSGTQEGRIRLDYKEGYIYRAKECSRMYATLCISGRVLSDQDQKRLCVEFNELLEKKRIETWSLFLPQFRESKEYARKRISFELAYRIVNHLTYV